MNHFAPTSAPALPTEPLLEVHTRVLARCRPKAVVQRWLLELSDEPDPHMRGEALFQALRKRLGSSQLVPMLEGLLASAADAEPSGVAGLAALVAVQAPGVAVLDGVREFRHLHRMTSRLLRAESQGSDPAGADRELLEKLAAADAAHEELVPPQSDPSALPSPLDLGPAGLSRRVFAAISEQLEETGELDSEGIAVFLRLAHLEVRAAEMRASRLASHMNPYSARAVRAAMPRLAELDQSVRDARDFLDLLAARRSAAVFSEQRTLWEEILASDERRLLLDRSHDSPRLAPLRRLLAGLQRRPLPLRTLAYYVHRLLAVGKALHGAHLRAVPLDPLEAVLLSLEHEQDGRLALPLGAQTAEALIRQPQEGVTVDAASGWLQIPLDPPAARRVRAPKGLPLPEADDHGPEEGQGQIKDLVALNLNNTSVLLGLLKNAKVVNTPGIVAYIASTCRLLRVLEVICETKSLHSGFANKDVPLALVRSPVRVPVKTLRRLIHVKYISKVELRRLARDKTGLRREVWEEVNDYLESLA
jgi:hypothetical protein